MNIDPSQLPPPPDRLRTPVIDEEYNAWMVLRQLVDTPNRGFVPDIYTPKGLANRSDTIEYSLRELQHEFRVLQDMLTWVGNHRPETVADYREYKQVTAAVRGEAIVASQYNPQDNRYYFANGDVDLSRSPF